MSHFYYATSTFSLVSARTRRRSILETVSFYRFRKPTRSDGNASKTIFDNTERQDVGNSVVPIAGPQVGGVDIGVVTIV